MHKHEIFVSYCSFNTAQALMGRCSYKSTHTGLDCVKNEYSCFSLIDDFRRQDSKILRKILGGFWVKTGVNDTGNKWKYVWDKKLCLYSILLICCWGVAVYTYIMIFSKVYTISTLECWYFFKNLFSNFLNGF